MAHKHCVEGDLIGYNDDDDGDDDGDDDDDDDDDGDADYPG